MQNNSVNNQNVRKFTRTTIQMIPTSQIFLGKYQKRLNTRRVAEIIAGFNPDRMRPIEVSLRDGKYWCWDGQHRLAAAKARGEESIECQVHYGLTYEDEARLFAEQQENVGTITTAHKFNALREANDPSTLRIIKKCAEYGFTVHPTKPGGKNIRSIKTLQQIERDLGANRLGDIVWIMKSVWDNSPDSTHENIIGGLATFFKWYLAKEDCGKACEENNALINRLHEVLSSTDAHRILQESTKYYGMNGNRRVALVYRDLFNKRRKTKLPRIEN